jgi:hypothetical protein
MEYKTMAATKTKTAPKAKAQTKTAAKAVAQPTVELYGFRSGWTGPSDGANKNLSRTKIDPSRFNAYPQGNMTERDDKNLKALRSAFGTKPFERRNVDAGILRRLMERGYVKHVSGNPDARDGMFAVTTK